MNAATTERSSSVYPERKGEAPFPEPVDDFNRYRAGISATSWIPSEREVRNMIRIVAYDISDPGRLRRVAKTCQDFGARIEKSVFECDLDEPHFEALWQALNGLIDPDEDAIVAYKVCRICSRETQSAGLIARPGPVLVYLP